MSSKDLFERLESARGTARPAAARPVPAAATEGKPNETTRVGSGVVRRRAATAEPTPPAAPAPAAPAQRTVIRRPAVRAEEPVAPAAPSAPAAAARRVVVGLPGTDGAATRGPVESPAPAVEEPAQPPVAPEQEAPVEAGPSESAEVPAEAPAAEESSAAASAEAPAAVEAASEASSAPAEADKAAPRTPGERRAAAALNQRPILPGLGLGVVSLPAGYDPTDPTGARRKAREQAATQPRWGAGVGAPGARPGGPGRPGEGGDADSRDRKGPRRGGRVEHSMMEISEGRKRKQKHGKGAAPRVEGPKVKRRVRVDGEITVAAFAHELGVKTPELIKVLMGMGQVATVNQAIDYETAAIVAQELGHEVVNTAFSEREHLIQHVAEDESLLVSRPPVVTVMGHVDHGKTTLLDTIRKSRVAQGEAGGITQHIGAYQVKRGDKFVTFIDTPGHSAFSAMRARGARVTDIVILVVAADDGVMPQTIEAISHAKAAGVPVVVAINKIDKPGVTPERIKQGLMEHGLVAEDFGGDTIFCPVSALKGTGIDHLLDSVLLLAEVGDFRANPDRHAEGVVLESRLETGRGAVASLLVKAGTLKQGDVLVIGNTWGRVRAMSDDRGGRIKEAQPSTPVEIFGLEDIPAAGDEFVVVGSEKDARTLADHRAQTAREGAQAQRKALTVDDLFKQGGQAPQAEVFHVVLKADVGGSLEALRAALEGIEVGGTSLKILHAAIGPVNESDVNLAAGSNGLVVAFNVRSDAKARQAAESHGVEVKRYDVIYQVIDEVKARLQGMLAPVFAEQKVGEAEVRAVFNVSKSGPIAGCMVVSGKVQRGATGRVLRDGKQVHEGKLSGLKRFKEDVREVVEGFECGIGIDGYVDIAEGDRLEFVVKVEVPRA